MWGLVNVGGGPWRCQRGSWWVEGKGMIGCEITAHACGRGGWWEKRSAIGVASLAMRAEVSDVLPHPMPVAELLKELDGFGCPECSADGDEWRMERTLGMREWGLTSWCTMAPEGCPFRRHRRPSLITKRSNWFLYLNRHSSYRGMAALGGTLPVANPDNHLPDDWVLVLSLMKTDTIFHQSTAQSGDTSGREKEGKPMAKMNGN